ncbi:MAG: hypothetical protein M0T84_04555 [Betaproteobacteria bacterium]|nr:hypothetical protein [Betaproteobacteria bacterium]
MSLANLIRGKSNTGKPATATPATFATQEAGTGRTVATVATVAVANPRKPIREHIPAPPEKIGATHTATVSDWWLIHFADREPLEACYCPPATYADVLVWHPDAVAAEPFTPTITQPSAPMTAEDEDAIRAWLVLIEEAGPAMIAEVLSHCQRDADARAYFVKQAAMELPHPAPPRDDRRTCIQCANLIGRRCQAAKRGEIVASREYEPIRDLPRRCEGYAPGADDQDRRHGRERWPALIQQGDDDGDH